ncbi:MAG: 50S ribosomal protein L24 [SAR324 cluster bacterium]|uniref:Large ribosomal subunit protein uL24 n=1 Tax=SAR324 cluster bacterium TaxID=2024889 RepID=A0A2A4TBM3_9DELT|nr:MAG: 50S ribosomal protein L24 [SAR324 cluster bacterium]
MKTKGKNKDQLKKHKLLLKRGDLIQVISGKDKGAKGNILSIDRYKMRVVVEGVNIVTKHVKPSQANQEGRIDRFEAPIHYSNVLLFCKGSDRGERLKVRINDDGSKTRVFAKSGTPAE